jgi:hypothetical protein
VSDWFEDLWKDIQKWWRKQKTKKPRKIENIRSYVMAKDVTITWDLPTTRTGGGVLLPEDILETRPEMSADGGANFNSLPPVPPDVPQEIMVPDLDPGNWHFRFVLVDTLGQKSAPAPWVETVVDESPPNPIENIQSTQT